MKNNFIEENIFLSFISIDNIKNIKIYLKDKNFNPTFNGQEALLSSIKKRKFNIFKELIKDERFNLKDENVIELIIEMHSLKCVDYFFYTILNIEDIILHINPEKYKKYDSSYNLILKKKQEFIRKKINDF